MCLPMLQSIMLLLHKHMQPQFVYLPTALWHTAGDIDPDTAIVPADVLSKQALDGQAEDLAMEDTLYALEKAMQAGSLTPDVYIKQVCHLLPFNYILCMP